MSNIGSAGSSKNRYGLSRAQVQVAVRIAPHLEAFPNKLRARYREFAERLVFVAEALAAISR